MKRMKVAWRCYQKREKYVHDQVIAVVKLGALKRNLLFCRRNYGVLVLPEGRVFL